MATLYFNDNPEIGGAGDSDWDTIDNWWSDAACETQASGLPTSSDSVVVKSIINQPMINSGTEPTIVNLTEEGVTQLDMDLTVTGLAIFEQLKPGKTLTGDAILLYLNAGTIDGDATIWGTVGGGGFVAGVATFTGLTNGEGLLDGTVGDAYFYNGCRNASNVTGDAYYYDNAYSGIGSIVGGNAEYYDYSGNGPGVIVGTGEWSDYSVCDRASDGAATFNDDSVCYGYELSNCTNATFNDRSSLEGFVSAVLVFNDYATVIEPAATDDVIFNDHSHGRLIFAVSCTINGPPVVFIEALDQYGLVHFVRRSGINGSSILGVV